jgi:hypothetical protein
MSEQKGTQRNEDACKNPLIQPNIAGLVAEYLVSTMKIPSNKP